MEFLKQTLENGLTIVAEANADAHSQALGFFVNTGARDETDEVAGVSHFLEHMMFKGTPTRSADDVNREFDEMGAHYNAYTSEEHTVYYAAILPEQQDQALGLLGDILRPSLRESDFNTEKKVILEEIQMYLDQPPYGADDKARAMFYAGHPLGRSVLGTQQSVGALGVEQMREYFRRRYSPTNITLAAAGKVDFERLVSEARRVCGGWERVETRRESPLARTQTGFERITREQSTQQYVLQLCAGPDARDPNRYAAKALAAILGDDSGSRLYWALIDPGRAEQASVGHSDYQGAGIFMTWLVGTPEETEENLATVREIFEQVQAQGVTQAELDQVKSKINSRVVLSSERPRGRLFTVGGNWIQRGEYRSVRDDLDAIDALSLSDIGAVLEKYPLTNTTTVTVGPARV